MFPMYHHYVRLLVEVKEVEMKQKIYLPAIIIGILMYGTLLMLSNADLESVQSLIQSHPFDWDKVKTGPVYLLISLYFLSRIVFTFLVFYTMYFNFKLIQRYQNQLTNYYSDPENHSIITLKYLLGGMVLTSAYSIVANSIGVQFFLNHPSLLMIPVLSISILIFFLGFIGNRFYKIPQLLNEEEILDTSNETEIIFGEHFISNFHQKFILEKAYLIPGIKITTLCDMLETNRTYLSVYINKTFHCNFCSLINKLRVEYSIQQLDQESIEKYSMNYLSELCGFSSINTFYRTFQKEYGMTPGQYLKQQENSRNSA
jgi:AraC-like DNA-binding protein